jgi:putative protease
VKNRFAIGDRLEIIHPTGNREMQVEVLLNERGEMVQEAPGSGHRVFMPMPGGNVERALVARFL